MNPTFHFLRSTAAMLTTGAALLFATSCQKESNNPNNETAGTERNNAHVESVTKSGGKSVCYVEVNSNSLANTGKYTLTTGGQQLFDIAIIFAANINYNTTTKKAVLSNNPNVTSVLVNRATQIVPLQNKGMKVLLSILGNHQGAGFCNFTSRAAAKAFAQQLSDTVTYYGLDGIDFDDEYAEYGVNNTPQPNDSSFVILVDELRKLMPTKIISFYYYGPAASRLSWGGKRVGDMVDYSWNAIYGSYSVPNVAGLPKSKLAPAAVDIQSTSQSTANSLATQTKNNGYGVYLWYNLTSTDKHVYFSGVSNILYGSSVTYTP
ncbi:endo-beta-N-acetylglucosaminidase H [Chitinophaga nivalis]|uniref:Endo-beta-N-acetylglucosaminidase family protein n=1 Tax=Chitinophaga nivalis TaxID=2991709 RepID=A0ABT3IGR6_9BACT|nr:endo-beta-N-acetylglucosaminidase H [Chitinophaga nivalis]MCW3467154.1 endo-beta-N-acetylglucosaminidase family protein [Chitinophaga nivalis]MCW3483154.1 endo-beta-N-acetylglucosaminidase family protein [Chitinophaga nivalis]